MKTKLTLFRRNGIYYSQDSTTGKQKSLGTRDEAAARKLVEATNEAHRTPILNQPLARAYLSASDPAFLLRPWQTVMDQMQTRGVLRQSVSGPYGQDRLGAGCPDPGTAGLVSCQSECRQNPPPRCATASCPISATRTCGWPKGPRRRPNSAISKTGCPGNGDLCLGCTHRRYPPLCRIPQTGQIHWPQSGL